MQAVTEHSAIVRSASHHTQATSYTESIGILELKSITDSLIQDGYLRVADASNLILMLANVKPSSLIVCSDYKSADYLFNKLSRYFDVQDIHFDPSSNNFYLIIAVDRDKQESLELLKKHKTNTLHVSGSDQYHIDLGVFLNVPNCCLVPRAVMPEEADQMFLNLRNSPDWNKNSELMRFTPHLPCCTGCDQTIKISAKYEAVLGFIAPDYCIDMSRMAGEKPLYLY